MSKAVSNYIGNTEVGSVADRHHTCLLEFVPMRPIPPSQSANMLSLATQLLQSIPKISCES